MRVSTTQVYQQGLKAFGTQQTKLAHLQQQISTGIRLTKPSDDPAAAARVLELEQTVSVNEQYQINIRQAEQRLQLEEATLNSVDNALQRIRELVIQGNNATMSLESRSAIADEIDEKYQELLSLGNTVDANGDYLFAGYQNKTQPFSVQTVGAIDQIVFNGDEGKRSMQISQSRQIETDIDGGDLFMRVPTDSGFTESAVSAAASISQAHVFDHQVYDPLVGKTSYSINFTSTTSYNIVDESGPTPTTLVTGATYTDGGFIEFDGIRTSISGAPVNTDTFSVKIAKHQDVFNIVKGISETLRSGASGDILAANFAQALDDIDSVFGKVLENKTIIGGRLNALEAQAEDNAAYILSSQETLSVLRDTDLAEAISQLTLEQTILDAAQAVFARVTSSSLFNFLR